MRRICSGLLSRQGVFAAVVVWCALATAHGQSPHTFDGRHSIATIDLTIVYLVPKGRTPLDDWRDRVDYFTGRIQAFHSRESEGKSKLIIHVHPRPLLAEATAVEIRGHDPNQTFFNSIRAARTALDWPRKTMGFPVLLVLSEINWRELDDFHRTRLINGVPTFEGNVDSAGRHFPGAESGGARATYMADEGMGFGLVSADGWRVPYSGSDCVVYHEGVGHAIGLPHPEPIDDSVMGTGQYRFWINQTWIDRAQKIALGWVDKDKEEGKRPSGKSQTTDLFSEFTAVPYPTVPKPNEPVSLKLTWPGQAEVRSLKVRVQTDLHGPWESRASKRRESPVSVDIGSFSQPTPVSYRVDVALEDGQSTELWGYFQVKGAKRPSGNDRNDRLP